jgi:hypothetical protein
MPTKRSYWVDAGYSASTETGDLLPTDFVSSILSSSSKIVAQRASVRARDRPATAGWRPRYDDQAIMLHCHCYSKKSSRHGHDITRTNFCPYGYGVGQSILEMFTHLQSFQTHGPLSG